MDGMADLPAICGPASTSDMSFDPKLFCSKKCEDGINSMSGSELILPQAYAHRTATCKEVLSRECELDEIVHSEVYCSKSCSDAVDWAFNEGHKFVLNFYAERVSWCMWVLSNDCGMDLETAAIVDPPQLCAKDCEDLMDTARDAGFTVTQEVYDARTDACAAEVGVNCGLSDDGDMGDPTTFCSEDCQDIIDIVLAAGHPFITQQEYDDRTKHCKSMLSEN